MADTINVNIIDRSVPIGNHKNIAIINQPNPAMNVAVDARELYLLINNPNYFITDSETGNTINGVNYYDYFPEASPGGGGGGGGSKPVLIKKSITDNGEYFARNDSADGYRSVNVNVPETPPPVLIEKSVTQNGTYGAQDDEVDGYSSVVVDVPNTYVAGDEGKVVSNGTLVAQTAMPSEVTENGTIDTTLYNSVNVNVPSGGTYNAEFIGPHYFTIKNSLKEIVLPGTVMGLVADTFSGFTALEKVDMSNMLSPASISNNVFYNCTSLRDVKMPQSITNFGNFVFAGCTSLENIVMSLLPDLKNDTFSGCTSLKSVTLIDGLVNIGARVFDGCVSLVNIDIPQTVTTIRVGTFNNLRDIEYIKFLSSTPPTIPNSEVVFLNLPTTCKILVPTGSLAAYTSAQNYPSSSTYTYEEY